MDRGSTSTRRIIHLEVNCWSTTDLARQDYPRLFRARRASIHHFLPKAVSGISGAKNRAGAGKHPGAVLSHILDDATPTDAPPRAMP
jgi:hypothetical protein